MLIVAVCDDEPEFLREMEDHLATYARQNKLELQILTFTSGAELLALRGELCDLDAIFLDIQMQQINGVEIAFHIRQYTKMTPIVFVTAYFEYALEGYKVGAVRYIIKEPASLKSSLFECMHSILSSRIDCVQAVEFEFVESGRQNVKTENILYVESNLHRLTFHMIGLSVSEYHMYRTLNQLENELRGMGFVRVHQSFLVNLLYIKNVCHRNIVLKDNMRLPVSRSRQNKVSETFFSYVGA